jgi:integrase
MRVPADLDPCRKMATLRINLGPLPIRFAERRSCKLAAAAEIAFAQLRRVRAMSDQSGGAPGALSESIFAIESRVSNELGWTLLQDLREIVDQIEKSDGYDPSQAPEEQVRRHDLIKNIYNVEAELRQPNPEPYVVAHADELRQGAFWLWANKILRGADGYATALERFDETDAAPTISSAPDALTSALMAQASALEKQASALQSQSATIAGYVGAKAASSSAPDKIASQEVASVPSKIARDKTPTFSEATEAYLAARIAANGDKENADIKSIRGRADLFATLIGNRSIGDYRHRDLQDFVDRLQYWPPKPENHEELKGKTATEIIEINKSAEHRFGVLARNTVTGHYVADVQSILNHAARDAGLPLPIPQPQLILPKILKSAKKRKAPSMAKMNDALGSAIESGSLEPVALPWLGMISGRRIGLLAFLRGSDFRKVGEHIVVYVPEHSVDAATGAVERVPNKNEYSRAGFIMHRTLIDSGFCEFAMGLGDEFLFRSRLECEDPADAAQKAINRLFKRTKTDGTFHGFRHWHITQMRAVGVSEYAQHVQSGHSLKGEHMDYGDLPFSPADAALLRDLAMPAEIDFGPLMRLDFSALRR